MTFWFSSERLASLHRAVLEWFASSGRDLPWRHTRDPYRILVAEVMLQQTQVDRVIPKYHDFLAAFPTLAALAAAPVAEVIRAWAGLGYNRRAVSLQRAAQAAVERFGGALPDDVAALESLPGVGRYTAAAIACFAFRRRVPVVDTNIRRVLGRVAGLPDLTEREAWQVAEAALPADAWTWNQALMDLGATICAARGPRCLLCPALAMCATRGEGRAVAEQRAGFRPARFEGSRRWYRGRAVAALRSLQPGESLPLAALGAAIKPDFSAADSDWIAALAEELAADGLARLDGERISLP
ncbi:MAG: A/G-specific adenine glycosylase [Chloroflexota bacterium]|nr:A/G-specific adenine glycosylase [Dehalococcoidia bacterium]MDW8255053.1 A/G-specific adenine glycosylase [Chloroflexota bacterium]